MNENLNQIAIPMKLESKNTLEKTKTDTNIKLTKLGDIEKSRNKTQDVP